jgi:hypothetical protein
MVVCGITYVPRPAICKRKKGKWMDASMKLLKKSDLAKPVRTSLDKLMANIPHHYAIHEHRSF